MNKLEQAKTILMALESHKKVAEHSKERIPLEEIEKGIEYWTAIIRFYEGIDEEEIPDYNQD